MQTICVGAGVFVMFCCVTEIKLKSASFCEPFNYPFLNKIEMLLYIFPEVQLTYNTVVVSGVQHSDSVFCRYSIKDYYEIMGTILCDM